MPQEQKELTAEEKEQFEKDSSLFFEEYKLLVKKYNIDFATYPLLVPDTKGTFKITTQTSPVRMAPTPQESPSEFIPK